jgi:surface antigen
MRYGHVAVVARVVNSRQVMVDHANWAPRRGGGRGQITKMVAVTDVSARNDWTKVRVWNEDIAEFGTRVYPTYGFIYAKPDHGFVLEANYSIPSDADTPAPTPMARMQRLSQSDGGSPDRLRSR